MTTLGLRGLFDGGRVGRPVVERVRERCSITDAGCWLWQGHIDSWGYGRTKDGSRRDGSRRSVRCHKATWEALHGPVPDGLQLDHFVCDNRACANPEHVQPVTPKENSLRAQARLRRLGLR